MSAAPLAHFLPLPGCRTGRMSARKVAQFSYQQLYDRGLNHYDIDDVCYALGLLGLKLRSSTDVDELARAHREERERALRPWPPLGETPPPQPGARRSPRVEYHGIGDYHVDPAVMAAAETYENCSGEFA